MRLTTSLNNRNNDLVDKKDPVAFTYYATYEESIHSSVYSFNYGYIHFICLNSNIISGYTEIQPQIDFIRKDMANPENKKRWVIVLMHEAPYQIVRTKRIEPFINVFYEVGVDLVLCGHHHCYTRSHRVGPMTDKKENTIDKERGVYYVMCQATGIKVSGKTVPTPQEEATWRAYYDKPGDPCYIMWDVTWDTITMNPYRVVNINPPEENINKIPDKIEFDTKFVITNKRHLETTPEPPQPGEEGQEEDGEASIPENEAGGLEPDAGEEGQEENGEVSIPENEGPIQQPEPQPEENSGQSSEQPQQSGGSEQQS